MPLLKFYSLDIYDYATAKEVFGAEQQRHLLTIVKLYM